MKRRILGNNRRDLFGRLLFVWFVVIIIVIYALLVFNKAFSSKGYLGNLIVYVILALLLISLLILFWPLLKIVRIWYGWLIKKIAEKHRKMLLTRKIKRAKRLERKTNKKHKIFFKVKTIKKEEKKAAHKVVRREKGGTDLFLLVLFVLSIIGFFVAYYYKENVGMIAAIAVLLTSLIGYRVLNRKRIKKKDEVEGKVSSVKALPKRANINLGRYETGFDALYKIVEQKGRVKFAALAVYLGIDKKKVEEWATILEKHDLVKIHYPAVGGPEVVKWEK